MSKQRMESKSFMTATDVETVRRSILEEIPNCEANISNSGDIPVIDAAPIRQYAQDHQATEAWQKSVADLDYALREVGFFSLANHGLDAGPAKAVSESFFQQPITTKMKQAQRPDFQFGYTAAGAEKLFLSEDEYDGDDSLQKTGDPKESLNIPPLHLPWRWPADSKNFDADRFRTTMTQYFEDCTTFSSELMQTLAVVLGEEADFFEDKMQDHMSVVRTLFYPAVDEIKQDDASQLRASAHSDFGLLTLLQTFGVPGLQVHNKTGQWIDVLLQDPCHLVVNIGDALSRMTNGVFKSTRHRVAQLITGQRQSIPFFVNFNENAEIAPVAKFRKADGNYPSVKSGEYIFYKNSLAMGYERRSQKTPESA